VENGDDKWIISSNEIDDSINEIDLKDYDNFKEV
jgi:hypothetical protein